ncbi:CD320 antigen isoform X2 [Ambystoma mexicanum]|uniref:CD320 antigen isoform X2 n=1 Tax=Ambystoma mexicanum TaxID=8296 RepID=UPI0037E97431
MTAVSDFRMSCTMYRATWWGLLLLAMIVQVLHGNIKCGSSEFNCSNLRCIPNTLVCDGNNDCGDHSDEHICQPPTCEPNEFLCNSSNSCLPKTCLCDGKRDCSDGSDESEAKCPRPVPRICLKSEFRCTPTYCIPLSWHCDGHRDCEDGSDERYCGGNLTCGSTEFDCGNLHCISNTLICDGNDDCGDKKDEQNCRASACKPSEFFCRSTNACLSNTYFCDGKKDCPDGSDELEDKCHAPPVTTASCLSSEFRCTTGLCIPQSWKCNGRSDCEDGSDENNCDGMPLNGVDKNLFVEDKSAYWLIVVPVLLILALAFWIVMFCQTKTRWTLMKPDLLETTKQWIMPERKLINSTYMLTDLKCADDIA